MKRLWGHLVFGLAFLVVLGQWVSPAVDAAAEPDDGPQKRLRLTVDAPAAPLALGDEAALTIVVTNPGEEPVENVQLYLPQGRGVEWVEPADGGWVVLGALAAGESRTVAAQVRVAGLPRGSRLRFAIGVTGDDAKPQVARVSLLVPRLREETATVPAAGGEATFARGRVRLVFPPGWNEQDAQVTFQLEELFRQQRRERGRLLLFTLSATAGGAPVESFDAPVAVTLAVGDLQSPDENDPAPTASTAPTPDEDWTPVESTFDPAAGTLDFTTTEPAAVQAATDPELWRLDYNPPGASAYSGSATYGYPIDLPPGIGGLTPDLSLSYSSRAAEGLTWPAMAQGFGAGWALPQAQINNGNSGLMYGDKNQSCSSYGNWRYTLVLNGVTYYLKPQSGGVSGERSYGRYEAIGSPELFIEYVADNNGVNDTANVSGEFWRLRTADGTTYTFGRTADAEQVVWPVSKTTNCNGYQPRNTAFSAHNWKLDSITDVHGNRVVYTYKHACGTKTDKNGVTVDRGENREGGGFQCSEVDVSVETVSYNFNGATAQTTATFTYQEVNGGVRGKSQSMTAGVLRPTTLEVKQGATRVAKYDFTYEGNAHWFPEWTSSTEFWWLTSITRRGTGTAALPIQSFTYVDPSGNGNGRLCRDDVCVKLLATVNNGYGAVTKIGYGLTGTGWYYVTTVDTWDGVRNRYDNNDRPQTRLKLTPSADRVNGVAQVCYDKAYEINNNPCHSQMGSGQDSQALIGFNTTTIETQAPAAATGSEWTTLNKTTYTFYNDDFWLLGKTQVTEQFGAGNSKLSRSHYNWTRPDGAKPYIFLEWEAHATFQPDDVNTYIGKTIAYTYYPINPAAGSYGGLKMKAELDETGATYRCTEYAYVHRSDVWLINRPARETVRGLKDGVTDVCNAGTKAAETLYRYAESNKPSVVGLDARRLLTYVLRWDGATYVRETRLYDARGLVTSVRTYDTPVALEAGGYTGTERNRTAMTYTALGMPDTVTVSGVSATNETQTIAYDATRPWLVTQVTDANNLVTKYAYDGFGRLTKVAKPGDSLTENDETVVYSYLDNGGLILLQPLVVGIVYKGNLRSAERQFYDGLGRLVQTQTAGVEVQGKVKDQDIIVTMAYDARGLEVCRTAAYGEDAYVYNGQTPFRGAACSTKSRTTTTYDALGRATSVTTPDGATIRTEYQVSADMTVDGPVNGPVDSHNLFLRTRVYDGNNHLTTRLSDVFGRLAVVREYAGDTWTDGAPTEYAAYADTRYNYDVLDNLTVVRASAASDPEPTTLLRVTTMAYDELGRKTTMNDADMGEWTYAYDPAGNLIRQKDSAGNAICFTYDGLNRLVQRQKDNDAGNEACPAKMNWNAWPAATDLHLASYVYGGAGDVGRLTRVYWGAAPEQNKDLFYYDTEGRLVWQYRLVNGQSFDYGLTDYDVLDRPQTIYLPNGESVTTSYDQEGANTLTAGGTTLIDAVAYNERGQLVLLSRAPGAPDMNLTYYSSGANFGRLNTIRNGSNDDAYPDYAYTAYDSVGNLKGMTATQANAGTYSFTYDELNRLKQASLSGAGAADFSYLYAYDFLGNITSRAGNVYNMTYTYGTPSGTPAVAGGPQAVTRVDLSNTTTDWSYNYDARGNLDDKYEGNVRTHDYTFDVENRLASVRTNNQTTTFYYDAAGQRVMTRRPDGTVVYTPFPNYEKEVTDGGAVTERATYTIAGQMVAIRSAGVLYYTYTDHLGNVVLLSKTNGSIVSGSNARYDPFGNYRTWPGSNVNPLISDRGFTGHIHDNTGDYPTQNVGLIYMNARYYLPEVGRFISPDTIVPEAGEPQSFNRYAYVRNSPLNFTDPTGNREIGANENDLLFFQPPPSIVEQIEEQLAQGTNVYGIVFDADKDLEWSIAEMRAALLAVASVDRMLRLAGGYYDYQPGRAFREVIGSLVFYRSAIDTGYGAHTFYYDRKIEFYLDAFGVDPLNPKFRNNVGHELGHAFNAAVVTASKGTVNPYDDLNTALKSSQSLGMYGARDGMPAYPWQQGLRNPYSENELFADYFLNLTYGRFLTNDAGKAQSIWMGQQMRVWLSP